MSSTDSGAYTRGIAGRLLAGLRERIRWFVRLPVAEARIDDLEARIAAAQHEVRIIGDNERARTKRWDETMVEIQQVREVAHAALGMGQEAVHTLASSRLTLDDLARLSLIYQTMAWIEVTDVAEDLKVSIILPSRDRAELLERAIDSVLSQSYAHLELVVIDDGSVDRTADLLASLDDSRLVRLRTEGVGVCAARNAGLDVVSGDVVTYLDDDNLMHHHWLRAVAWAFSERPDVEVLYGARVVDDYERVHERQGRGLPWIQFAPFDREHLEQGNSTDIGVIAHRTSIPGIRFDPQLIQFGDWDLFLQLVNAREPLELPAIAGFYTTTAPGRLSNSDTREVDAARIHDRQLHRDLQNE